MEDANGKLFSTKDFYISAFLIASGHSVIKIDKSDPSRVFFFFNDFEAREGLVKGFLYSQAKVEPQSFITAIKALKQLIHSND